MSSFVAASVLVFAVVIVAVVVPADVIREATEAVFRICGMTVRMKSRILDSYY